MISTNYNSSFPDQVVPDEEKQHWNTDCQVGRAIEYEWFRNNRMEEIDFTNYKTIT